MALPSQITASINGNGLNGIIYSLKNTYGITSPVDSGIVIPSGTETNSKSENINNTIAGWKESCWVSVGTYSNPFYQVYFPMHWISITGYSLRSCSESWTYPKIWKVYGFNDDNKNQDESKWDVLGENTSTASQPYCYTSSDTCSTGFQVGTFTTKITGKSYKYLRFVLTEPSRSSLPRFVTSGFDVFGTLSSSKMSFNRRRTICTCLRKRRIVSPDVVYIIIGMSLARS